MSDKHQKAKPAAQRTNAFTKAGPNSRSGGKNRHAVRAADVRRTSNDKPLFERRLEDRRAQDQQEREDRAQSLWNFRVTQAELAKTLLRLHPGSLAEKVALLVIDAFPDAKPNKHEKISRTEAAKLMMLEHLSSDELDDRRSRALELGVKVAGRVLYEAYEQLTNVTTHPVKQEDAGDDVVDTEVETKELVSA